ncbi:MAG: caspase family protein [Thermodesulfovibrionales bacterium]|nr:caspase family protein [Thermodesulfovibrionales bacterium]
MKYVSSFLIVLFLIMTTFSVTGSQQTPVTQSHIAQINNLFKQNNIVKGYVAYDRYGRLELKGEYQDEKEVDVAFSLAQSVVGIRWVSPVTPENIKVKEWERQFGELFKRSLVVKPPIRPDATEKPGPIKNRYALVVGIGKFKYPISPLQYATTDAQNFYNYLIDAKKGGFPRQNVTLLLNEYATRDRIQDALNRIRTVAERDDLVVIYFSSHGAPPDKGAATNIVTYDTNPTPPPNIWWTSLNEKMLKEFIDNLRALRLVMILDTCYSNGAYKDLPGFLPAGGKSLGVAGKNEGYGVSPEYGKRLLGAKDLVIVDEKTTSSKGGQKAPEFMSDDGWGKVLISASSANELSWESEQLRQSIFTYYFIDGLNRNNGSVKSAFTYAKPLVNQRVQNEKAHYDHDKKEFVVPTQTPQVIVTNQEWDMKLSQQKIK